MKRATGMISILVLSLSCSYAVEPANDADIPSALCDYVNGSDSAFSWKLVDERKTQSGSVYEVELISQRWQQTTWKHALYIYEPKTIPFPRQVLLFVTGGSTGSKPGSADIKTGAQLANLCGARVAMLYQVPNQPLMGGRKEDDLISETWLRFLETGDANWPLLFPMVKSAVKAMDAVQDIATSRWKQPVDGFVITGASKRGWTSWLAPVADQRIIATAPIVIDTLNFQSQIRHQLETWGEFSEQIVDYTSKGLIKQEREAPREIQLRLMMDPYTYRNRLTLPKLLINGTNDRYWVLDATRFYWHDLKGPKYVLQVPNAGHSLKGGRDSAFSTLAAFFRQLARGARLPVIKWVHSEAGTDLLLTISSSLSPRAARLWSARSASKDFRDAEWQAQTLELLEGTAVGRVAKPKRGHVALFGELQFEFEGLPYVLSTLIRRE